MKNFYLLSLFALFFFPSALIAQNYTVEIRNQRIFSTSSAKFFEFKVYLTRNTPGTNLNLGNGDLRINFPYEKFTDLIILPPGESFTRVNATGELNGQMGYTITPAIIADDNGVTNILNITIGHNSASHFPDLNGSIDPETEEEFLPETINIAEAGTFIGTFRIKNPKPDAGLINLTWRPGSGFLPTKIFKYEESNEDGMDGNGVDFKPGQFLISEASGNTYVNPSPAFPTDLHVHFTGDGGDGTNLYRIFVQSTHYLPLQAGSIGFYVYYSSQKANLISSSDDQISGAPYNWGAASTQIEEGSFINGFDRRFKYTHSDGTQSNDTWPAYVEGLGQGINIGAFRFNLLTSEISDPMNVVYFEPIDATSFKNHAETINYSLYIDGATRPLGIANGTLPITLTRFTAAVNPSQGVALQWTTAMEKDNREFIIQRSTDAKTFTNVKTIAGAGNSSQTLHYNSTDEYPLPGVSYYRLAQVDFDGTTSYSKVVAVKQNKAFSDDPFIIGARPNPFHTRTEIQFQLPAETPVSITVTDALGKVIATDKMAGRAGKNAYTLKGDQLANGIYFFTLHTGSESSRFKLVKNR